MLKKKNNQGIIAGNNGEDNRGNIGGIC